MTMSAQSLICPHCKFDMGDGPGESGRCAGCGTPLGPSKDHEKPAPGFQVPTTRYHQTGEHSVETEEVDKHIVTDADREAYPELLNVRVIERCKFTWYAGIGAEPAHGYFLEKRRMLVDLTEYDPDWDPEHDFDSHRDPMGACPECGCETGRSSYSSNGYVGGFSIRCIACDHAFVDELWD